MRTHTLTAARLREVLDYDPHSGLFTRKNGKGKGVPRLGTLHHTGYRFIGVDGVTHLAHRLAWLHVTGMMPNGDLDHRNLNKSDNRYVNLRVCDDSLNQANVAPKRDNKSGYKGVCWNEKAGKWQAGIKKAGKSFHLGLFDCPAAAHLAYSMEANRQYGEFARPAA